MHILKHPEIKPDRDTQIYIVLSKSYPDKIHTISEFSEWTDHTVGNIKGIIQKHPNPQKRQVYSTMLFEFITKVINQKILPTQFKSVAIKEIFIKYI
jgi:hypothetical protein